MPLGGPSLIDIIFGNTPQNTPEARRREAERAARIKKQQASGVFQPRQMEYEPNIIYDPRKFLFNVFSGIDDFAGGKGPVWDTVGSAVQSGREAVAPLFETPASRKETEAAKPKPAGSPAAKSVFDNSLEGFEKGLIDRGIPGHIARGVAAGILGESLGDAGAFNSAGGGQGAFGLNQWRGSRQAELKRRYGDNPTPEQQLDFLAWELKGGDQGGKSVMSARTPAEALQAYVYNFQRPGADALNLLQRSAGYMGGAVNEMLLGGPNGPGTLTNPFSPRFAQAQLSELEKARTALKTPTRTDFDAGPMPLAPEPVPVPKSDFSKSDAALQALKPVEFTMKEAENLRWANFWGGLGQAMMRSPEGEGLGSFFLRLGGGALASVGQTRADIQERKDLFDAKMAKWNAAVYENDFSKAQIMQREALMDWENNNRKAMADYQAGMTVWSKTAVPTLQGNDIVSVELDPKTGKGAIIRNPIGPLVDAAIAGERAGVLGQMFGVENAATAQMTRYSNGVQSAIATSAAGQVMADAQAAPAERAAAGAFGAVNAATFAVTRGMLSSVLGEDAAETLAEEVSNELIRGPRRLMPGTPAYDKAALEAAIARVSILAMQSPEVMNKLMETMGPAAELFEAHERYQARDERYTRDSRGRSSYQVTYQGQDE